jgi:hypothetical protein
VGFLLALLPQPFEQPAHPLEVEVHHVVQRELEPAASVLVIKQAEDPLPQLVGVERREQAVYVGCFALEVGRKKPRSKGS